MSGGQTCGCAEKREPLTAPEGSNRPARLWRVVQHRCNHSAFNGYHYTPSKYSSITCLRCGRHWRTKASYADRLPLLDCDIEMNISAGYAAHERAMEDRGADPISTRRGATMKIEEGPLGCKIIRIVTRLYTLVVERWPDGDIFVEKDGRMFDLDDESLARIVEAVGKLREAQR